MIFAQQNYALSDGKMGDGSGGRKWGEGDIGAISIVLANTEKADI